MNKINLFLFLLIFSGLVNAWGLETQKYLCEQTVTQVWGADGVKCLDSFDMRLCNDVSQITDLNYNPECEQLGLSRTLHPATIPILLFNDTEKHYNFDTCPLKTTYMTNEWICDSYGNPAKTQFEFWKGKAINARNVCERINRFCIGLNYYTDSKYPLNQVNHLIGCYGVSMDKQIDSLIGTTNWSVSEPCVFEHNKPHAGTIKKTKHTIGLKIDSTLFEEISDELIQIAYDISDNQYQETETINEEVAVKVVKKEAVEERKNEKEEIEITLVNPTIRVSPDFGLIVPEEDSVILTNDVISNPKKPIRIKSSSNTKPQKLTVEEEAIHQINETFIMMEKTIEQAIQQIYLDSKKKNSSNPGIVNNKPKHNDLPAMKIFLGIVVLSCLVFIGYLHKEKKIK